MKRHLRTNAEQSYCAKAVALARQTLDCVCNNRYHAAEKPDAEIVAANLSCYLNYSPLAVMKYCAVGYWAPDAGCRANDARAALKLYSFYGEVIDVPLVGTHRNMSYR